MSILAPDHYKLQNADGTQTAEYWVGSKLVLQQSGQSKTFTATDINVQANLIGNLVSVVAETFPDSSQLVFTVLLPAISLQNGKQTVSFQTQGVLTKHWNPNDQAYGPLYDTYTWVPLSGVADLV